LVFEWRNEDERTKGKIHKVEIEKRL